MKLTKLLTGAAVAALLGGAAQAYTIEVGDIDAAPLNAIENAGTTLAEELNFATLAGPVELWIEQDDDGIFTTDDVQVTLTFTNAVFSTPFTTANIFATCAAGASVSSGGGAGDNSVTLLVSGINNCDNSATNGVYDVAGDFGFRPDIAITGAGSVSVSTNIVTDSGGTKVDGGVASNAPLTLIELVDAFSVEVVADPDAIADLDADPIYTAFEDATPADDTLGTINIVCDTTADIDFANTAVDCQSAAQLAGADLTINGDFTGLSDFQVGVTSMTVAMDELSATLDLQPQGDDNNTGSGALTVTATVDGAPDLDPLQNSSYTGELAIDLGPAFIDEAPFPIALASIVREGTQVIVPWVASAEQLSTGADRSIIRITNHSDVPARAFVEVQTSSLDTFPAAPGPFQLDDIPPGGEIAFRSSDTTAIFGADVGRTDLEFVIEATPDNVSLRHLRQAADGGFNYMENDTVDIDQQ